MLINYQKINEDSYEKGSILKDQCEKRLNEAKLKVEEIEYKENNNKNLKQSLDE